MNTRLGRAIIFTIGTILVLLGTFVFILLTVGSVQAATRYVDGGCLAANGGPGFTGDGTSTICAVGSNGTHGAFLTIGESIDAAVAGDTTNIRGPHSAEAVNGNGAFDGIYREDFWVGGAGRPAGVTHGKGLNCTAAQCTFQGYNGERPIMQGAQLHSQSEWVSDGGGVYHLPMTAPIDGAEFDSNHTRTGTDGPLDAYSLWTTNPPGGADAPEGNWELPYSTHSGGNLTAWGDNDPSPPHGYWSYCTTGATGCVNGAIYVNPPGTDLPWNTILVPFVWNVVFVGNPTNNVTWQDMDFRMSRQMVVDAGRVPTGTPKDKLRFIRTHFTHYPGKGIIGHGDTNVYLEDPRFAYCGRGKSWESSGGDTCYGFRFFQSPGGKIVKTTARGVAPVTFQYLGSNGLYRFSAGALNNANGITYSFGDLPWRNQNYTGSASRGHAMDVKQTIGNPSIPGSGFDIEGIEAAQAQDLVVFMDTSTEVTLNNSYIHECGHAVGMSNFTPSSPFLFSSNDRITNNVILNTGLGRNDLSAINICATDQTERQAGEAGNPSVYIYNNWLINSGWSAIFVGGVTHHCLHATTDPDWVVIDNNSISGTNATADARCTTTTTGSAQGCRGIVVADICTPGAACTHGITIANTIITGTNEPLVTSSSTVGATNFFLDYSLYGGAPNCLTNCGSPTTPCDQTNMLIRDAGTIPQLGTTNPTSSGVCRTLPSFQGVHQLQEQHGVEGSPAFVSSTDLHLQAQSDAIDTGQTETLFSTDIDNGLRPAGAAWDKGAVERGSVVGATTTSTVTTSTTSTTAAVTTTSTTTSTTCQSFNCTETLGFSQTGMWFLPPPDGGGGFLPIVDPGPNHTWELQACASGGLTWMDFNSACWSSAFWGPACTTNSTNPDRVLLTISTPSGTPDVPTWTTDIQTEIVNLIGPTACIGSNNPPMTGFTNAGCCTGHGMGTCPIKFSNTRQVILQPVVGGPNNSTCATFNSGGTGPVHASLIAPTIDTAIAAVVAADPTGKVVAGDSPEVRTCNDYGDSTGHLCSGLTNPPICGTLNARLPIGQAIGNYYAGFCNGSTSTTTTTSSTTTTRPGQTTTSTSSTTATTATTTTTLAPHGFLCQGCTCTGCNCPSCQFFP